MTTLDDATVRTAPTVLRPAKHRGAPAVRTYYLAAALVAVSAEVLDYSHLLTAVSVGLLVRWAHMPRPDQGSETDQQDAR